MISVSYLFELHPQNKQDLKTIGKKAAYGAALGGILSTAANQYIARETDVNPLRWPAHAATAGTASAAATASTLGDIRRKEAALKASKAKK